MLLYKFGMKKSTLYVFNITMVWCYSIIRKGKGNRNPIQVKELKKKEELKMKKLFKFLEEYYKTIVAPKW